MTQVGLVLPDVSGRVEDLVGGIGGIGGIGTATQPVAGMISMAQAAERAGFDSIWVEDRIRPVTDSSVRDALAAGGATGHSPATGPDGEALGEYEAYSLLGGLAVGTLSVRLGALPVGEPFRPPAVLSKIATTVDVLSRGRGTVSLSCSSQDGRDRSARLAEELQICRKMMEDQVPTFNGEFFSINAAINSPRPVQPGGLPLVVFSSGDVIGTDVLQVVARLADAFVVDGDPAMTSVVRLQLDELLREAARPPRSVSLVWLSAPLKGSAPGPSEGDLMELVKSHRTAGADGCILQIGHRDAAASVALIEEIAPRIREMMGGPEA